MACEIRCRVNLGMAIAPHAASAAGSVAAQLAPRREGEVMSNVIAFKPKDTQPIYHDEKC